MTLSSHLSSQHLQIPGTAYSSERQRSDLGEDMRCMAVIDCSHDTNLLRSFSLALLVAIVLMVLSTHFRIALV